MSNAISGALHAQQVAQTSQVAQDHQSKPTAKQTASLSLAPQDKVTISSAAQAASKAENQQSSGKDPDHDGK
jgi:hypothetical protein